MCLRLIAETDARSNPLAIAILLVLMIWAGYALDATIMCVILQRYIKL